MYYRLYAKKAGTKRFAPIDWRTGNRVVNLIHATIFSSEERATAERELEESNRRAVHFDSPGPIQFEFRPVKW